MTIHFVIGPAGSGKTTYRVREFPQLWAVDIHRHQWWLGNDSPSRDVRLSYSTHRRAVMRHALIGWDFVIEHTMLRAQRRAYYINKLRANRLVCHYTTWPGCCPDDVMDVYELPTIAEGFDELVEIPNVAESVR